MTKIKICGLSREADIQAANRLKPDYIGFVFASGKRQITGQQAAELKQRLDPAIKAVGVFVKAAIEEIVTIAEVGTIDLIQLHGDQSPEFCRQLRLLTGKPIIKVIRVKGKQSLKDLQDYACDYFLLDTFSPSAFGGIGKAFDYALLEKAKIPKPFFIAGGLNTENVKGAIKQLHPYGVDTSGGVETDGSKDFAKMAAFIEKVKRSEGQ